MIRLSLLSILLCCGAANPAFSDEPDLGARYRAAVRAVLDAEEGDPASALLAAAGDAIRAWAASGDPAALEALAADDEAVAARRLELASEIAGLRHRLKRDRSRLQERGEGSDAERRRLEERIGEAERRLEEFEAEAQRLEGLADLLYEGLLDALDRSAAVPDVRRFDLLLRSYADDSERFLGLERDTERLRAQFDNDTERLSGRLEEEEKETLELNRERRGRRLELLEARLERSGRRLERRLKVLASAWRGLPEERRAKERRRFLAELRKGENWKTRALWGRLLGELGVEGASAPLIEQIRRSAQAMRKLDEELDPLREKYQKALEALMSAIRGGNGMVPASVVANKNQRERELREASERRFGEERVLRACSRGLSRLLARRGSEGNTDAVDAVLSQARRARDPLAREGLLRALVGSDSDAVREWLREVAEGDRSVRLRLAALDELATIGDEATVDLCIDTLLRDRDWRIRAAAIAYLGRVPRKRSIPALIGSLAMELGRLVDDAEKALESLTGESFGGNARLWKEWWTEHEATFRVGKAVAEARPRPRRRWEDAPGKVSFYGIRTRSRRIVFVIDRSGSMREPVVGGKTGLGGRTKIDVAKSELEHAVAALEDDAHFNIITYAADVGAWKRRMVEAKAKSKKAARRWIGKSIVAEGGTNIHDALLAAFRLAGIGAFDKAYASQVDTIFFLSDGQPTVGEVQDPEEILARVREWNRLARVVIHTVGVGKDHDAAFLRRLAEENGGTYVARF